MNPEQTGQPQPPQPGYTPPHMTERHQVHNPLNVMQAGESVVCMIKRHPIGIIGVYVGTGLLLAVLAVLAFIVAPNFLTDMSRSQVISIGSVIFILFAVLSLAFAFISNIVYWGNSWTVTTDSITQVTQTSLFNRQSSQLSLGNLEDVTAEQNGILTHIFNYGLLRVETAGERSKFMFLYCPNPNYYATQILDAREKFEQNRRGENPQALYRGEGDYQQPAQYQPPVGSGPGAPAQPQYGPPAPPQPQQPQQYQPYPPQQPAPPTNQYYPPDNGVNINTQ